MLFEPKRVWGLASSGALNHHQNLAYSLQAYELVLRAVGEKESHSYPKGQGSKRDRPRISKFLFLIAV